MEHRLINPVRAVVSITCGFMLAWVGRVAIHHYLPRSVVAVLSTIINHCDPRTMAGFCWSIDRISAYVMYSRSAVEKALAMLRARNIIAYDGQVHVRHGRPIAKYRIVSSPQLPLPEDVITARDEDREAAMGADEPDPAPGVSAGQSTFTYRTTVTGGAVKDLKAPHGLHNRLKPSRSVADAPSPKPTRASAERAKPAWIPQPIANRLTSWQQHRAAAAAEDTTRRDGISATRLAERVRRWWNITTASGRAVTSPLGWLWHAIEARPYGCADPRCEDGDLWDGDRVIGRCCGCVERRRDRAVTKRSGTAPTAPWTAPWAPAWVREREAARAALTALVAAPTGTAPPDVPVTKYIPDPGNVRTDDSLPQETGIGYPSDQRGGDHRTWSLHDYRNDF